MKESLPKFIKFCKYCNSNTEFVRYDAVEVYKIQNLEIPIHAKNCEKCLKCGAVADDDQRDSLIAEYILSKIIDHVVTKQDTRLEEDL